MAINPEFDIDTSEIIDPGEQSKYWDIFKGEKVSLAEIENESPARAFAARELAGRGLAVIEENDSNQNGRVDRVIFIPHLFEKAQKAK